jgi:predicted acyltransferase (DUF342 family)
MTFDRKTLVIPDGTCFKERVIFTKGDVVIGDRALIQFGINTEGRIFVGEHVITDGNLEATDDVRIDIFSNIFGDIRSGGNVYLGEKVRVKGKLSLKGDLDVGDSVELESGFEAKGWINIRNPLPIVLYIFIYLVHLLKMGHSEEIERLLQDLEQNDGQTIPISESFLFVPSNAIIGVSKSEVDCNFRVGKKCKVLGNYDVKGDIFVDDESNICGTLNSSGDVFCGKQVRIDGNILSKGEVSIGEGTVVAGDVSADKIFLSKSASVNGVLLARRGVLFMDTSHGDASEKVKRFESDVDVVDEVKEMLE